MNVMRFLCAVPAVFFLTMTDINAMDAMVMDSKSITIEERKSDGESVKAMRMPRRIPIQAEYDSMISAIIVAYASNLGEVYVEVCNLSSGEVASGYCDTSCGSQVIGVSGSNGVYVISFTMESGVVYQGEFEI